MGNEISKVQKETWISETAQKITIGTDPEFVLTDTKTGLGIYGDTVFENKWAQLGSDGPCAELRPNPSNNVEDLIKNIEILLVNAPDKLKTYGWIGGATYQSKEMSRRYAIGGHIHFGLPDIPGAGQSPKHILQRRIVRILDELIALPLIRIDTPNPEFRRNLEGYGRFEDAKTYDIKFEWRVPSGIWLVHKEIATAVLGSAKAVVEECWKKYEDRDYNEEFMLCTRENIDNLLTSFECLNTEEVRNKVNEARTSSISTELVGNIHTRLRKMSTYCRYKEEINNFFKICCSSDFPLPAKKLELKLSWLNNNPL